MIEKLMNFNHFTYKKPFSGSDKGNKFKYIIQMVEREEKSDDPEAEVKKKKVFQVICWEGEKNSKETPDEAKQIRDFEFTEEGYDEVLKWLQEESDKIDE